MKISLNIRSLRKNVLIFFAGGHLLWLLETWYFGWNMLPSCPAEFVLDAISAIMIILGWNYLFIFMRVSFILKELKKLRITYDQK